MKHLKTYENLKEKKYWLLPTDNRLKQSLEEIGAPEEYIINLKNQLNKTIKKHNFVYVGYNPNVRWPWSWREYENEIPNDGYDDNDFNYYGMINMEIYDLDAKKYNL